MRLQCADCGAAINGASGWWWYRRGTSEGGNPLIAARCTVCAEQAEPGVTNPPDKAAP